MACGAATDSLLRVQAGSRSSCRHHQAKAQKIAAKVVVLQAATAGATAPSGQAAMASNTKYRLQRPSQELRFAHRLAIARTSRLYRSMSGLIT
jgi:hypothetical protein